MAPLLKKTCPILLQRMGIPRIQFASAKIGKAKMSKKNWEFPVDPKEDK